jgi:predicted MFS family arabinose efflux permease
MNRSRETKETSERLLTRPLLLLTFAAFSALFGFQSLLSVVPLYANEAGGGSSGAGLATTAFMLTTVLTQMQMPRLLRRFGYGKALTVGLLLLGPPALLYLAAAGTSPILAVTLLRGIGFGIVTVVFAALIAELAPPGRRGEALGLLGIAITVPTIFANPLGLWLVERFGYEIAFLVGGLVPALGLGAVLGIRRAAPSGGEEGADGFFAGLRRAPLRRLAVMFAASTMAAGVIVTFLPLATPATGPFSAASALLIIGVVSTVTRWWAGRYGDRRDARSLLAPGLVACAVGTAVLPAGGIVLVLGAAIFGAGFGFLENATLVLMMERVSETEYGLGSTLWNAAFDAGTGVGALVFGFVISAVGFTPAFALCAALVAAALILVTLDYANPPGAGKQENPKP